MNEKITGPVIAAIIVVSLFAALPMASAESRGDNFNHIVEQTAAQKVLIGQNLQFDGYVGDVTVSRIVSGDIENMYLADGDGRIYNVNWPTSGVYYVNYDSTTKKWEAQLSVEEPNMPLEVKIGTAKVSSLTVGTNLTIDTSGMNLFPEDQVDLVIKGPHGQVKYDDVNGQQFTGITVAELNDWYGNNNLETTGWTIGAYTFKVETDDAQACGLEGASVVKTLRVRRGEIEIYASMTSATELETVKIGITGVVGDEINVAASPLSDDVVFNPGIDDTPMDATNSFNDRIDADGFRKYAVEFTDTGSYTLKVTVTGPAEIGGIANPRVDNSDTVDIMVLEKAVEFDMPNTAIIGERITVKGTATSGTYVSVYVDDTLHPKLTNIVIEDGEFSEEVRTTDVGMNVPGSMRLKAWIDCGTVAGEERPTRSPDGENAILLTTPSLTAELSADAVALEDDFTVFGTAQGATEVTILSVPPNGGGGKSLLDKGETGPSLSRASVSTTDYRYSRKMTVQEDASTGYYDLYVVGSGMDEIWGMTGEEDLNAAFEKKYGITVSGASIATKTQTQIENMIENIIYAPGSDDLMWHSRVKVESAAMEITKARTKAPGEPVVVTGTSNRKDGYPIVVTCEGPVELTPVTAKVENGAFEATFDTRDAERGTYEVKADDGERTISKEVRIRATYLVLNPIDPLVPGETLEITGMSNIPDGNMIVVTYNETEKRRVIRNGTFGATFETVDAVEEKYNVTAESKKFGRSAGAVAIFNQTIMVNQTQMVNKTLTVNQTSTPTPKPPGFEAIFAIAGLLAVAYLVRRK